MSGSWVSKRERIGCRTLCKAVAEIRAKWIVVAGQQGKAVKLVGVVIETYASAYHCVVGDTVCKTKARPPVVQVVEDGGSRTTSIVVAATEEHILGSIGKAS